MSSKVNVTYVNLVLALGFIILLYFFYNSLKSTNSTINKLYQHPFIVSNSVQAIEKNIVGAQLLFHNFIESRFYDQSLEIKRTNRRIESIYSRIEENFVDVKAYYLGDMKTVNNSYNTFKELEVLHSDFNQLIRENKVDDAHRLVSVDIDPLTTKMVEDLTQLHLFAQNKAIEFKNNAHNEYLSSLAILVVLFFYTIGIVYYIHKLNTSSLRDAYKHLKKEMKWRKNILNATPDAIIISNRNGEIIDSNEQASILTGYPSQELRQLHVEDLVPLSLREKHKDLRASYSSTSSVRFMNNSEGLKIRLQSGFEMDVGINLRSAFSGSNKVFIAAIRDITNELKIRKEIEYQTNFDALTGLPNRTLCEDKFNIVTQRINNTNENVALIFIDLDDFKKVNDTLGHEVGDKLLCKVADRFSSVIDNIGTFGRLGGDEFLLILDNFKHLDFVQKMVNDVLSTFNKPFYLEHSTLKVSCSMGVSIYPNDGRTYSELLRKADAAMYHAKSLGKNQFAFYFDSLTIGLSKYFEIEEAFLGLSLIHKSSLRN